MSNETKNRLLGQSFGAASNRLRKMILYSMLYGKVYSQNCFRCGQEIAHIDDLSIEHKDPWQAAADPKVSFFDLNNIAFSHLSCNYGGPRRDKTHCPQGHEYNEKNTIHVPDGSRKCRKCNLAYNRRYDRSRHGRNMRRQRKNRV